MTTSNIRRTTSGQEVSRVLDFFTRRIPNALNGNFIGLYLFGSLSYGDFNPNRRDIDLVFILVKPASRAQIEALKLLHSEAERIYPEWAKRVEVSYTPIKMFSSITPPKRPRPYYGEATFYSRAPYGNEWVINNYLLYEYGKALIGPDFKSLVKKVDIEEVQKACVKDLFQEWEPKIRDKKWLNNSHYQSYLVLNLCRILYTVMRADARSKKVAATWVKAQYPKWADLINTAENWQYGTEMNLQEEVIEFIKFVIIKVRKE